LAITTGSERAMKGLLRLIVFVLIAVPTAAHAQTTTAIDSAFRAMRVEALEKSQLRALAQPLMDSIGPRLTGSAGLKGADDWVAAIYKRGGIAVRAEAYGTARNWRRGTLHVDLMAPHVRSLEGMLMTFSAGTKRPAQGPVIIYSPAMSRSEFELWLRQVSGKFVAVSLPEPTCRPDESWQQFSPASFERMQQQRAAALNEWVANVRASGRRASDLFQRISQAGGLGVLVSLRPNLTASPGWGTSKIGTAVTDNVLELGLSCEDYGLVYRLAEQNQGPALRVEATARFDGETPLFNIIGELRGAEKPNEYVVLSAHLDSWDAASGATDNGTGTVLIMEAMRILKAFYPHPRRTILATHWSGEEQGLRGSRAFAAAHPEVLAGLQALFNQDSGTGQVVTVSTHGLPGAGAFLSRWLAALPKDIATRITVDESEKSGGSDDAAFTCYGAPAFGLQSSSWDYEMYTWHSNRDTFDKLIFDELKTNAALIAMLAYLASEESQRVPHGKPGTAKCK
jgi:carboxypeptidase Q